MRTFKTSIWTLAGLAALTTTPALGQTSTLTLNGSSGGDQFGIGVCAAGDLDGDGVPDIVVGANGYQGNKGRVQAFSGATGATIPHINFVGNASNSKYGGRLAANGDFDNDGITDIAVGVPNSGYGGQNSGEVFLYSGATGQLVLQLRIQVALGELGSSVTFIEDVDGDGRDDIVSGAPQWGPEGIGSGRVYLYSGATGQVMSYLNGPANSKFGTSVTSLGDIDGDGKGDFAVGAPGTGNGTAYIYSGGDYQSSAGWQPMFSPFAGTVFQGRAGDSLGQAIDWDRDGLIDLAVGSPKAGRVDIVSCANGQLLESIQGDAHHDFGFSIAGGRDVNGDGLSDMLIGSPAHNQTPNAGRALLIDGFDHSQTLFHAPAGYPNGSAFGYAVAISPDPSSGRILVGVPFQANGSVEVYDLPNQFDSVVSYGSGSVGSGGFVPQLGVFGVPAPGEAGTVEVRDALGGAPVRLLFGFVPAAIPLGCCATLNVSPLIFNIGAGVTTGSGPGNGELLVPYVIPSTQTTGISFTVQAAVIDPGAVPGYAVTNGVQITL